MKEVKLKTGLTRRESFRRAGIFAAGSGLPFGCATVDEAIPAAWQNIELGPVDAPGYGTDPDLLHPAPAPWPLTLTQSQRQLCGVLADILIPAEEGAPAATAVGVVEVLDEWISAPYPEHQTQRQTLVSGFDWCEREAQHRYGKGFVASTVQQQLAIVDDIAFVERATERFASAADFFDQLRRLVAGIYYSSPQGVQELGYMGNVPISGDWPGPTPQALAHLDKIMKDLGLDP